MEMYGPTMITRSIPLLAGLAAALPLASPVAASPSPKVEYVFAVKEGVMNRCIGDADIVFALANAALEENLELGRCDVHRVVNSCTFRYRHAQRDGLTYVALEALKSAQRVEEDCRERYREPLAEKTFGLITTFTGTFAGVLHGNLVDACSRTHDLDCVDEALTRTAEQPIASDLAWLYVDDDGRLAQLASVDPDKHGTVPTVSVSSAGASRSSHAAYSAAPKVVADILMLRDVMIAAYEGEIPDGSLAEGAKIGIEETGFTVEDGRVQVSSDVGPLEVSGINGMMRITATVSQGMCTALLDRDTEFGATEITVGKDLWVPGSDAEAVCPSGNSEIGIVYE
ncbi:hypothetical protein [Roseivivax sp. CAU 1761]